MQGKTNDGIHHYPSTVFTVKSNTSGATNTGRDYVHSGSDSDGMTNICHQLTVSGLVHFAILLIDTDHEPDLTVAVVLVVSIFSVILAGEGADFVDSGAMSDQVIGDLGAVYWYSEQSAVTFPPPSFSTHCQSLVDTTYPWTKQYQTDR